MKVYGYGNNKEGIMDIENSKESFTGYVCGDVKVVSLTAEYVLVCNCESSLDDEKLEPNVAWFDNDELVDIICGNCFVCRRSKENFSGIEESDTAAIKRMFVRHKE